MTTLFLYLLFGIPVLGVEWLIGKFNKNTEDYQCLRMVQRAFKLMISMAGTEVTVIGEENIPDEPVLFIGNRSDIKAGMQSILTAIDKIKSGISICIFPEGTRNDGEELSILPFHSGSFKIAEKSGCPIVPISMNNTASIFENQFPRIKKTHVIIEYGKPIYPCELDKETKKRLATYCQNLIQETINKNQALL